MLLEIEIPKQKENSWFEVDSTWLIVSQVISTAINGDSARFMLDCRIPDPTSNAEVYTKVVLINKPGKNILHLERKDGEYFALKVTSVRAVKDFPHPY